MRAAGGEDEESMPADRKDLEARVAAATPNDTVRGLVFNGTFSVLRELGGEGAARECDPLGTGSRIDFFSYPVVDYLNLAWAAADHLEAPLGGVDQAFHRIGHRALTTVFSSMLGRTLLAMASGDVARLLSQMPNAYRATVSYGECTSDFPEARHFRMAAKHSFLVPPFHCGMLTAAIEMMGGRNVNAVGRQTGFLEAEYDCTWE
jgi:uncharacterized protein (TIGR02265 family)